MALKEEISLQFNTLIEILGDRIYDSPYASLRENLQNAVDAVRIRHKYSNSHGYSPMIHVNLNSNSFEIFDNGIGMNKVEMQQHYWAIGNSGKKNMSDICIGTFGIGAFANFGIANKLTVISRKSPKEKWIISHLSKSEFSINGLPKVNYDEYNTNLWSQLILTSKNNSELSGKLKDDFGTLIIVSIDKPIEIKKVLEYIEEHIKGLDIPIYINDKLLSKKDLLNQQKEFQYKETRFESFKFFNINGNLEYSTYENEKNQISIKIKFSNILSGIIHPEKDVAQIFNHGFKLCNYPVNSRITFQGIFDSIYFRPTAGRDSLNSESSQQFSLLIKKLTEIIANIASESNDRLLAIPDIFNYAYYNSKYSIIANLKVPLEQNEECSLVDIASRYKKDNKKVFYTLKSSGISKSLSSKGHSIIILPSDYYKQNLAKGYLEKYCDGTSIESYELIQSILDVNSLKNEELEIIKKVSAGFFEITELNIKVIPAILKENLIFYWKESLSNEDEVLYFNIKHEDINFMLYSFPDEIKYKKFHFIKELLLNHLGEQVFKYRKKTRGEMDLLGIKALIKSKFKIYTLTQSDIQRIGGKRKELNILPQDVQTISSSSDKVLPPLNGKIIIVQGSYIDADEGCYLQLDEGGHKIIQPLKNMYETLSVSWSGNTLFYHYNFDDIKLFQTSIEFTNVISLRSKKIFYGAIDESRRPIFQEKLTYIPIPKQLEAYTIPDSDFQVLTLILRSNVLIYQE